jgi:hypothetical protein
VNRTVNAPVRALSAPSAALLLALAGLMACGGDGAEPASSGDRAERRSATGFIGARAKPYEPTTVAAGGTIVGTGAADTTVALASAAAPDAPGCAAGSVPTPTAPATIAWTDGIDRGKPMPVERRYEVVSEECALSPRVSAVVVGGTINLRNDDRAIHRLVFIRQGAGDTVQVMPFSNAGQLVASDRLARTPGLIEVRCAEHQGVHGYIAVFDHPYFAVATGGGEFTIDDVPAGSYTMKVWTEGATRPIAQPVKVEAGSTASLGPRAIAATVSATGQGNGVTAGSTAAAPAASTPAR